MAIREVSASVNRDTSSRKLENYLASNYSYKGRPKDVK